MRVLRMVLAVSTLVGVSACGRGESSPSVQRDLAWLDSLGTQPRAQQAVASPVELSTLAPPAGGVKSVEEVKLAAQGTKPTLVSRKPGPSRSTASASRRSSSSSRARASSSRRGTRSTGTYASAPARQPRVVTKKNTVRDAAIGAGVGGVVGAVAGGRRHRGRGAVIGAVVGGAAGAVIGNNVDVQRRIEY